VQAPRNKGKMRSSLSDFGVGLAYNTGYKTSAKGAPMDGGSSAVSPALCL
jgi:hypothetical protein